MFNIQKNGLFGTYNITTGMYVLLIIISIIIYIMIFYPQNILSESDNEIYNKTVNSCISEYDTKKFDLDQLRGSNYWLSYKTNKCNITRWEILHLLFHVFLGYFYNIYISQGISFGFELYEQYYYSCGSYLDLGYNFTGFLIGHMLKNYINYK
jgi:hypothetical protein